MISIKYVGGLIRYEIQYRGVPHIFSEKNNYILQFEDDFAKELLKKAPNIFKIANKLKEDEGKTANIKEDVELKENEIKKNMRSK